MKNRWNKVFDIVEEMRTMSIDEIKALKAAMVVYDADVDPLKVRADRYQPAIDVIDEYIKRDDITSFINTDILDIYMASIEKHDRENRSGDLD